MKKQTNKEILKGNTLISVFMGLQYKDNFKHIEPKNPKVEGIHKNSYYGRKNGSGYMLGGCYYYEEWNWLMPVFNKIIKLGYPYLISNNTTTIYKVWMKEPVAHCHKETTLKSAWHCVIEFIKWYNENKK